MAAKTSLYRYGTELRHCHRLTDNVSRSVKAKLHYTGPTGPARTRTDPTEFLGDPGRKKVRTGPVGPV